MKKRKLTQQHKFKISEAHLKKRVVKKAAREGAKAAERAAFKTGSVVLPGPPVQVLKPFYPTVAGGVRIVLDLDDLARTLNFIDLGANNEILPAFLKMLKPWGLPHDVLYRFQRIAETGAP